MGGCRTVQLSSELSYSVVQCSYLQRSEGCHGRKGGGIYRDSRERSLQRWLEGIGKLILALYKEKLSKT